MSTSVAAASDTVAAAPSQEELLELISKLPPDDMKGALKALVQNGEAAAMQVLQDIYKQPCTEMELAWQAYQQHTEALQKLKLDPAKCLDEDLWGQILSFVGPGHYAYVAGVNRQWKNDYKASFAAMYRLNPPPTVFPYLGAKRPATSKDTFYRAAFSSISCANFWKQDTMDQDDRLEDRDVCNIVAMRGKVEVMKWAKDHGFAWNEYTCRNAARGGHLDLLKYLHENACPWGSSTCYYAAENGHFECLKYAHKEGCPWNALTCVAAAQNGHLKCLEYAHKEGCNWDKHTCNGAALYGHLNCLEYAHTEGCGWDADTFAVAAEGGHMDCLEYLRKERCPWDATTYRSAVGNGHHEIAEWAKNNGCPVDEDEDEEA